AAVYAVKACEVKTDGGRIEASFSGATVGPFAGSLRYTVYKGTNLIRQEIVASTDRPSVAYKYDAGLKGLAIQSGSRAAWRDVANTWQSYFFGGAVNQSEVPVRASNRVLLVERDKAGTIAAFPPPHTFFWAREVATNLGYTFYRKDSDNAFAFGVRQAEREETPEYDQNFALYSARPGTTQRMALYLYPSAEPAQATLDAGPRAGRARPRARLHPRQHVQAARRLPGDEPPLSHGPRAAADARRQPRRRHPRSRRASRARPQHREPDRLGRDRRRWRQRQ